MLICAGTVPDGKATYRRWYKGADVQADNMSIMRRSQEIRVAPNAGKIQGSPIDALKSADHAASGSVTMPEYDPNDVYRYDDEFDTSSFDAHYKF